MIAVLALVAGLFTYAAFADLLPQWANARQFLPSLLWFDLIVVLALTGLIVARLAGMWVSRRRAESGSRLHVRLVLLFSLVAVAPTLFVATFSGWTLNSSLQDWFTDRVRGTLDDALSVSDTFLQDRRRELEQDLVPLTIALRDEGPQVLLSPEALSRLLSAYAADRNLVEVAVVDQFGSPLARAQIGPAGDDFWRPPLRAIEQAMNGAPLLLPREREDRISALLRLYPSQTAFLYVSKPVDTRLLAEVNRIRSAVSYYDSLEGRQADLQLRVAAIFSIIVVAMLLFAVWIGITYATRLSAPISGLVEAAEQVSAGDLSTRVGEGPPDDEFGQLSRAFNRMTEQLASQRGELVDANKQLDDRRRFTEAVLEGVTSGVVSLDGDGIIKLANRAASELLAVGDGPIAGRKASAMVPHIDDLLMTARNRPQRAAQQEIEMRINNEAKTLLVRVAAEIGEQGVSGYVVTFDDVTDLLSAQRMAAWADVARRIAHEIKNPLTPIQLSAERLKRKYLKAIKDDPETFAICTDTIIRQVGDIGRMVDEFSSFARMPRPVMHLEDLKEICQQALFLQRNANATIQYHSQLPDGPVLAMCDRRQIGQALTNVLKNAAEAIEGRMADPATAQKPGEITLILSVGPDGARVRIEDNGKGLPQQERARLTEPYVTTRGKGTGLGLAIVKKIMEDHGGNLLLEDRPGGGACVSLRFGIAPAEGAPATVSAKTA